MKVVALLLPALAAAGPLKARDEALGSLIYCNGWLNCPLNYECVPVDVNCKRNCPGYCFPNGGGLPTATLPTTNVPTATLPTGTGLPTTNIVPRVTMAPRNAQSKQQSYPSYKVRREEGKEGGGEDGVVELGPLPYDEETLKIWGDKLFKYRPCGGFRPNPAPACPKDHICISAPWGPDCGIACDGPGICVKPVMCGGIAGVRCPNKDDLCIDWPGDGCHPKNGGADCAGICI